MREELRLGPPETPEEENEVILDRSEYLLKHIAKQYEQVVTDYLTGLKNRKFLVGELEQALKAIRGEANEKRKGSLKKISLISIDIDHFKQVNDTLGHPAGDEVLKKVAELLAASVRGTDVVARVGGEEMMVLMKGADLQAAAHHAEELRAKVEQLTFDAYPEVKVKASFGVASSEGVDEAAVLYANADKALYKAKEGGRNKVVIYNEK